MSSQTRKNGRRAKLTTKYCLRFPFCWANQWVISISYDSGLPHLTVGLWFNLYGGRADFRRGSGIALYHFFSYDMGCCWVPATPAIWRSHVQSCPHAQKVGRADGEGVERAWSVSIPRPLVLPSHKLAVETDCSQAKRRVDPDSIRVSKHALMGHSGRRNCEGWTCRSNGEYNLGVPNLASFGELACEKVRQHGEFPWNQKENTYLVPGAETRWPSDVGWLDQEITGIQFAHAMAVDNVKAQGDFLVMSQTTPGSENNPHLVDMPLENAKRPTKLWAERCSPSEPQAQLATPSSSQTVLLNELGSIEAHLQPSYRTAIVSVDFLEEV
ncbi:hypothetical protein B0H14DRAFT_2598759 [Mycena olivaceomarginata]|nr:hypothetical protein B0H14DRAFT_2598759 [Mycena olivaceomarginata]